MNDACVLIIDDEPATLRVLQPALQGHHYAVVTAMSGAEGLNKVEKHKPQLILLDLCLPDIDGTRLVSKLREQTEAAISFLSARSSEHDKIAALDNGVHDYITKPFSVGELVARMRAALRSYDLSSYMQPQKQVQRIIAGDIAIDLDRHAVNVRGEDLHLTPTEFNLLEMFVRNPGKLVTHSTLLHRVWGPEYVGETQLLRVYIGNLRAKIEPRPEQPRYILAEPRLGYRYCAQSKL
jgi:two-component system KDP operon response regulator KdpE